MSKHDLQARPIYHHNRESIDAHLTIVFAALAVSHWIEHQTGWSIKKFVRTARRYRTVTIQAGQQTLTAAEPLPDDLAEALAKIAAPVRTSLIKVGLKFPAEISLSMSMSRAWFATSFFNREFSASSSLSRFASLAFMPPYWAIQRCHVDSATSRCRHTSSSAWPAARSLLPSASLRMI